MKYQLATLAFYAKHSGWHSFSRTSLQTKRAVKRLTEQGFLETNEFHQARFTGKVFLSSADNLS